MDDVIKKNDKVTFLPDFSPATLISFKTSYVKEGDTAASIGGNQYCSAKSPTDVKELIEPVKNCLYKVPGFTKFGQGTLNIKSLNEDQLAENCEISPDKKAILKGSRFKAVLQVMSPAMTATTPPKFDSIPGKEYLGTGRFQTKDVKFQAK